MNQALKRELEQSPMPDSAANLATASDVAARPRIVARSRTRPRQRSEPITLEMARAFANQLWASLDEWQQISSPLIKMLVETYKGLLRPALTIALHQAATSIAGYDVKHQNYLMRLLAHIAQPKHVKSLTTLTRLSRADIVERAIAAADGDDDQFLQLVRQAEREMLALTAKIVYALSDYPLLRSDAHALYLTRLFDDNDTERLVPTTKNVAESQLACDLRNQAACEQQNDICQWRSDIEQCEERAGVRRVAEPSMQAYTRLSQQAQRLLPEMQVLSDSLRQHLQRMQQLATGERRRAALTQASGLLTQAVNLGTQVVGPGLTGLATVGASTIALSGPFMSLASLGTISAVLGTSATIGMFAHLRARRSRAIEQTPGQQPTYCRPLQTTETAQLRRNNRALFGALDDPCEKLHELQPSKVTKMQ